MVQGAPPLPPLARAAEERALTPLRPRSQDIHEHPLESFTLHGFNPLTSHKREWIQLLPSFLSLLSASNIRSIAFIDVPSLRNARRHRLDWSATEPMTKVTTVQISLALDEDTKDHGDGGEDFEEDEDETSDAKEGEANPMSERVRPSLTLFLSTSCTR